VDGRIGNKLALLALKLLLTSESLIKGKVLSGKCIFMVFRELAGGKPGDGEFSNLNGNLPYSPSVAQDVRRCVFEAVHNTRISDSSKRLCVSDHIELWIY
jgi:hypothetical protein